MIEALLSTAAIVCSLSAVIVVFKAARTPAAKTLNPIPNFSSSSGEKIKQEVKEVKIPLEFEAKNNVAYVKIVLPESIRISEEAFIRIIYESLFANSKREKEDEKKQ